MRINKFIAAASGLSRRAADQAIAEGRVLVNGQQPTPGQDVTATDTVLLDLTPLVAPTSAVTIVLHKPAGFVVSRNGQGSRTIYDILPNEYHHLKPVGRLDKDSSGLLLLTSDGQLAQELTHPSHQKTKVYQVTLNKPLRAEDRQHIEAGVRLEDGPSKLALAKRSDEQSWQVTMHEGRNRQIRRTFEALGYRVTKLHRTQFGDFVLGALPGGATKEL